MATFHPLTTTDELEALLSRSFEKPQLVFKHSTRCSVSTVAHSRLERKFNGDIHLVDVLASRGVSNAIAEQLKEIHESPQALVVKNGEATLVLSHLEIDAAELEDALGA